MELEKRHSHQKPSALPFVAPAGVVLIALFASSVAVAQGTAEQRAACEDEARWLCSNYIPDAEAVKGCMLRNLDQLSPRCRAMFDRGSKARARRGRRAR